MDNQKNNNKSQQRSPAPDLEALSKAYAQSLDNVMFGDVPLSEVSQRKTEKKEFRPKDYKAVKESSPEHDKIVRKIRERNKKLSHSVWTDEPVLKPKKSVWLDDATETFEKVKPEKTEPVRNNSPKEQTPQNVKAENDAADGIFREEGEPVLPLFGGNEKTSAAKGMKREVVMSIAPRENVRIRPAADLKRAEKKQPQKNSAVREVSLNVGGRPSQNAADKSSVRRTQNGNFESRRTVSINIPVYKPAAPKPAPVLVVEDRTKAKSDNKAVSAEKKSAETEKTAEEARKKAEAERLAAEYDEAVRKIKAQNAEPVQEQAARKKSDVKAKTQTEQEPQEIRSADKKNATDKATTDDTGVKVHELEFNFINSLVCIAAVFIVFFSLLFMKRESGFINSENRNLAEFPKFSFSSYFAGDYTKGITDYFTDTVPGRENFKKFCADFSGIMGVNINDTVFTGNHKVVQKEELDKDKIATTTTVTAFTGTVNRADASSAVNTTTRKKTDEKVEELPENLDDGAFEGDVIVCGKGKDIRAMGAYYGSFDVGAQYADTINKWKEEMPDVNIYNMSIPLSSAYYIPNNLRDTVSDQKDNIDNIAANLKGIINVDVFDNIGKHTDEYIYSRTDHHWQPLGAYYAAEIFAEKAGIEFPALDTYEKCEIEDFVGTMYAYSNYNQELADNPDTFVYYKPDNEYAVTYYDTSFANGVSNDLFFDYAEGVNCYSAILNVDNEIAEIETDCDNGRVLVIFKDSFGNAIVPFLTHGFSKIYVCDFRYFDLNAIEFCRQVGCTDLLFPISITSCSTPTHITALNNIRIQSAAVDESAVSQDN